ncbi:hypothetical protein AKJ09_05060 [Labilithrix luteola]|uniref:Cytochrome c domain-containing protein n=1 Tax=Labilithrix luteola TaxID=1391654 RepID=A0A0K1PYD5_9BACT|nr:hypothetical protein AKJ09_05060 [Labilithrix luteola]
MIACSTTSGTIPHVEDVDAAGANDADEIPCEPRHVLETVCQQCHSLPTQNGAPFPLVNRSDVLAERSKSVTRELMIAQLESGRMPLRPVTIEDGDREILLDWLRAGAPSVSPRACTTSPNTPDSGRLDSSSDARADADVVVDSGADASSDAPDE